MHNLRGLNPPKSRLAGHLREIFGSLSRRLLADSLPRPWARVRAEGRILARHEGATEGVAHLSPHFTVQTIMQARSLSARSGPVRLSRKVTAVARVRASFVSKK